ncbi:MAG: spore maturation protein [Magnetococcales bacterium]|nr:spore maturation protein [Magnetococcales bacterium]MBF0437829.1 spore maturation protein [Magnetococcales bacterium]
MNLFFFVLVAVAFGVTAIRQLLWSSGGDSPMQVLTNGMVEAATNSVNLAIGMVGVMALFLGLMKVAEEGGLLTILARLIRPLMVRLFPDVPADHPAMGAMILNLSANALGLGNAATPFGIRAMKELDRLNPEPGTATNAMALFLAINTSSVTLVPTSVIALRASVGSADPAAILSTTLFATFFSTLVAILAAKSLQRLFPVTTSSVAFSSASDSDSLPPIMMEGVGYPSWVSVTALVVLIGLIPVTIVYGRAISPWVLPVIMTGMLAFGYFRGVRVYEVFVEGAREGFEVAVRIIPYLVAILVAVGMFRASGALGYFTDFVGPLTAKIGLPADALTMAILRPLSGSGAQGYLASLLQNPAIGPDGYVGMLTSTLQGSSETTFYILAVYYGAIRIRRVRHTLAAALLGDLVGVAAAVFICSWLFSS